MVLLLHYLANLIFPGLYNQSREAPLSLLSVVMAMAPQRHTVSCVSALEVLTYVFEIC